MSNPTLAVSMLAVFVIAAVFLFVAVLLLNRRPTPARAAGDEELTRQRRNLLIGSIVCVIVGLALMATPIAYLFLTLIPPA